MVKPKPSKKLTFSNVLPWLIFICGLVGLAASFALTLERFSALQNPHYVPVCNLNPIFSCSTVSASNQAHAFGFYNPFLGLAGFAAVATIGVALLAGARFKRWLWQFIEVGLLFSVVFVTWLQFETLYRIGALCLFCMVTWVATIPLFWYVTLYNLREGNIRTPARLNGVIKFAQRHSLDILVLWFLIIIALILKRFWYYYGNL